MSVAVAPESMANQQSAPVSRQPVEPAAVPTEQQHSVPPAPSPHQKAAQTVPPVSAPTAMPAVKAAEPEKKEERQVADSGKQERPEFTKVILTGDRLRKYFPDVSMTPREIEESVYEALEERRQRQEKMKSRADILKKNAGPGGR